MTPGGRAAEMGELHLQLLQVPFKIVCPAGLHLDLIARLWASCVVTGPDPGALTVEIVPRAAEWDVAAGDRRLVAGGDPWSLAQVVRFALIEETYPRANGYLFVHAAGVATSEGALLLAGSSGAGKTTLTIELLKGGWSYLSDDVVPVARPDGLAHPFPRPLGIKDPGRWEGLARLWEASDLPVPRDDFLIPPTPFHRQAGPVQARWIVFLARDEAPEVRLRAISAAEAVARCALQLREVEPSSLHELKGFIEGLSSYELAYSNAPDAAAVLRQLSQEPQTAAADLS